MSIGKLGKQQMRSETRPRVKYVKGKAPTQLHAPDNLHWQKAEIYNGFHTYGHKQQKCSDLCYYEILQAFFATK
jgi:hypothetical protein